MEVKYLMVAEDMRWSGEINEKVSKAKNKYGYKFCLMMSAGLSLTKLTDMIDYYKLRKLDLNLFDAIISYTYETSLSNPPGSLRLRQYDVLKDDRRVIDELEDHYEDYRRDRNIKNNVFVSICRPASVDILHYSKKQKFDKKRRMVV